MSNKEVPEAVQKCLSILKAAKNDTEKFAGLFMITKLIKGKTCNSYCKKLLFEAIGFTFLKRLLLSTDVPADCPPQVYKSVAMSVLSAFCRDPEIAIHSEIVSNVSVFLDIIEKADADDRDNLILINETYECLLSIAAHESGRKALFDIGAIIKMAEIYTQESFQTDEALNILVALVSHLGPAAWGDNSKSFNGLINVLSLDFKTDDSERKFKLCKILQSLLHFSSKNFFLSNNNSNILEEEQWPGNILKGLTDILSSKIGKNQRDPALILAAEMIQVLGVEWAIQDEEKPKQFFLLLIQLSSVEVRMQLEDRKFEQIMDNAELVISCFSLLEACVSFIASDCLELEQKEKQSVYTALKGAFSAVITTLTNVSKRKEQLTAVKDKLLVYGMIRALSRWLAQETSAIKGPVLTLMPFVLNLANESFYSYRSKQISMKMKKSEANGGAGGGLEVDQADILGNIDLLRILMPALCHLVVEDKGREIFLKTKQEEILLECLTYHWSIVHYVKPPIPKSERLKARKPEPELSQTVLDEMEDSRSAMISICNIFMNITVLETKLVEESLLFGSLSKFIFNNLPELKQIPENLVLHGNMAVLGLLLLKQQSKRVKKDDFTICRFIQCTIRFLWDAYSAEDSNDGNTLVVSMRYKKNWIEIQELWFLGMQTLSSILPLIPWISEFAIESGWVQGIMEMLKQIKYGLPANTKCAYEDFLIHLIDANKDVKKVLKQHDALNVCRQHRFMEVGKKLFGD